MLIDGSINGLNLKKLEVLKENIGKDTNRTKIEYMECDSIINST